MRTDEAALDRLADAVVAAHDPWLRLAVAVSGALKRPAAQAGRCEEVKLHAERRGSDGVLLRIEDVACGRAVEATLSCDDVRGLVRFLNSAR